MELDSARNAKIEVFRDILSYEQDVTASSSPFPMMVPPAHFSSRLNDRRLRQDQEIAVGIGKRWSEQNSSGFELVLYLQRARLQDKEFVEEIRAKTKNEVRVVVTGPISKQDRVRPLKVGCSTAHYRVSSGTLGAFVTLPGDAGVGFLSNNHVLADMNAAKYGDVILQPGKYHKGQRPEDICGSLHSFVPIDFSADGVNYVDCAVATRAPGTEFDPADFHVNTPDWMPRPTGKLRDKVELYEEVFKVGHTTGATRGEVVAVEVDNLWVRYSTRAGRESARFDQQYTVRGFSGENRMARVNFSRGGDSGSLIFDVHGNACALLFAGSDVLTIANPLPAVLDALDCQLYIPG